MMFFIFPTLGIHVIPKYHTHIHTKKKNRNASSSPSYINFHPRSWSTNYHFGLWNNLINNDNRLPHNTSLLFMFVGESTMSFLFAWEHWLGWGYSLWLLPSEKYSVTHLTRNSPPEVTCFSLKLLLLLWISPASINLIHAFS